MTTKSKRALAATLALIAVLGTTSCLSGLESVAGDVDPTGWNKAVTLLYENRDTLTARDISLALRHNADATPVNGVYLVEAMTPSGVRAKDTLQVTLPSAGNNNLHETRIPFRTGARFTEQGEYVFSVVPLEHTLGVWSVAMEFRKNPNH